MKSPIILATLFAGSLAAVIPGLDILPPLPVVNCVAAGTSVDVAVAAVRPMIPNLPRMEDAIKTGVAAFKHKIKCGPAPPEPEEVPEAEKIDCKKAGVDKLIDRGRKELALAFELLGTPAGYPEGVEEAIRVFRKVLGCQEQAKIMAGDI